MADNTLPYVRPRGRPKVEKNAKNDLRTITRLYDVDATAVSQADIESKVFLTLGEPDLEYTTALLVDQKVEASNDVDQATLTRMYMELPGVSVVDGSIVHASARLEMEDPKISVLEGGRYMVVRKWIANNLYLQRYDEQDTKTLTVSDVAAMGTDEATNTSEALAALGSAVDVYTITPENGGAIDTFLGSRKIVNHPVYCIIEEKYHSADDVVSEAEKESQFGVVTSKQVINPTAIPASTSNISVKPGEAFTTVSYSEIPDGFKKISESEQFRQDGSRMLTRRYAVPSSTVSGPNDTPDSYIPVAIANDSPTVVTSDFVPDVFTGMGINSTAWDSVVAGYTWIRTNVSVNRSHPRMDTWSITWTTAGLPYYVDKWVNYTRPGKLEMFVQGYSGETNGAIVVGAGAAEVPNNPVAVWSGYAKKILPVKKNIKVRESVWYVMGDNPGVVPEVTLKTPHAKLEGNIQIRGEGKVVGFGAYPNFIWDLTANFNGLNPADLNQGNQEGKCKVRRWFSLPCFPGTVTISGGDDEKANLWEIKDKIIYAKVESVFRKAADYIWKVTVGKVLTTTDELYG